MLLKKFFVIIVFLALTSLGSTIPPNIASKIPPKTLQILDNVPLNLSKNCASALQEVITNPEILNCIPLVAILPILPIITDPNFFSSIKQNPKKLLDYLPQLDQFSDILCGVPKCSNKSVQGAINTIKDGCNEDLKEKDTTAQIAFGSAVFFSPVRDITCFKVIDKDKYCKDETAKVVLDLPNSPINITHNAIIDAVIVSVPKIICTRCNKDIVNTLFNFLNNNYLALNLLASMGIDQSLIDKTKVGVAFKCGIEFEDGIVPDLPSN
ncbi:10998_t:CDS:2 [Dentiscutata heterogama]|uniref:10998_t:CDS:1 n=1 Tax=Dentiscutata heterogama TaxID=1316150 RepID=A0ACA9NJ39_9GLOM|nr:10998_t:CDS:2 [Dentiscutata heterogama]